MRLGGFSLLGLLVAMAIVALLLAHALSGSGSSTGAPGVGSYQNVVSQAEHSVAQQDQAATQAQSSLP